jgi:hypothetical protein
VSEVNIIETWQQLLAKYLFFMPKTFRDIDPATLERRDAPAGVFPLSSARRSAMNLLIHQDYGDHSRKAVIEFFTDGIQFWNPGDSFADEKHLLDPGEKDVRNPAIAMAIRRIGMCEQAGTGPTDDAARVAGARARCADQHERPGPQVVRDVPATAVGGDGAGGDRPRYPRSRRGSRSVGSRVVPAASTILDCSAVAASISSS